VEAFLKQIKGDRAIWMVTLFLGIASILLVYSSIVTLAYRHHDGNSLYYLLKHSFFVVAGFGMIWAIHRMKYSYFSRIAQVAMYASIPLLLLTLTMGTSINSANRWLTIPIINQTFQTSDFAKLALMMYVARMLALRQGDIKNFKKTFLPIIIPVIIVCGLILPADLSTAALLFVSCFILMFIGRISGKHLAGLAATGVLALAMVYAVGKTNPGSVGRLDTWVSRMEAFATPAEVNRNAMYQTNQAKIAIATGGIPGKGPGNSTQRNFLPHPYSDFIFAIVLEEYGLLGGFSILLLYLILLYRSVRIVQACDKPFGGFLAIGISFSLVFQALINMAVAVNLLPVTGQPLPMVSMGGTSIWLTCIAIGIILSVSRGVEEVQAGGNKTKHAVS